MAILAVDDRAERLSREIDTAVDAIKAAVDDVLSSFKHERFPLPDDFDTKRSKAIEDITAAIDDLEIGPSTVANLMTSLNNRAGFSNGKQSPRQLQALNSVSRSIHSRSNFLCGYLDAITQDTIEVRAEDREMTPQQVMAGIVSMLERHVEGLTDDLETDLKRVLLSSLTQGKTSKADVRCPARMPGGDFPSLEIGTQPIALGD